MWWKSEYLFPMKFKIYQIKTLIKTNKQKTNNQESLN